MEEHRTNRRKTLISRTTHTILLTLGLLIGHHEFHASVSMMGLMATNPVSGWISERLREADWAVASELWGASRSSFYPWPIYLVLGLAAGAALPARRSCWLALMPLGPAISFNALMAYEYGYEMLLGTPSNLTWPLFTLAGVAIANRFRSKQLIWRFKIASLLLVTAGTATLFAAATIRLQRSTYAFAASELLFFLAVVAITAPAAWSVVRGDHGLTHRAVND